MAQTTFRVLTFLTWKHAEDFATSLGFHASVEVELFRYGKGRLPAVRTDATDEEILEVLEKRAGMKQVIDEK